MIKAISRFQPGTLRSRLILSVALVHAIMMSLFIIDLTIRQRDMLMQRQVEEAIAMSQSLATSAAGWIAADDISGLQELVDAQRRYPEILFAALVDEQGRVLADTDNTKQGQFMLDLPGEARQTVLSKTPTLVDVVTPAMIGGRQVGWARIGIGQEVADQKLAEITRNGIIYAFAAILIGSVIAWFMGDQITRRLYAVQETIDAVRSGNRLARSRLAGRDEAAVMAHEFNSMLDSLTVMDTELRASENKYRSLIQKMQTALLLHDNQGRILAGNPLAQHLLGLPEDQFLGRTWIDLGCLFWREDGSVMPIPEYPVSCVLSSQQPLRNYVVGIGRKEQDEATWVLINAEPEYNEAGVIEEIIVSFMDITRRKQVERALRESDKKYSTLLETSTDIILTHDLKGRITYINRSGLKITGYTETDLIGTSIASILPPDELVEMNNRAEARQRGELGTYEYETKITGKSGKTMLVEVHSAPIFKDGQNSEVLVNARDITGRKLAEEILKEQYSTLHGIIESTNAYIFSVDREYRYTSFNSAHASVMRAIYNTEIQTGHSLLDYMTVADDREKAKLNIDRALAGEHLVESAYSGEEKRSRLYFEVSHNPISAEDGTIIGVVVLSRDITERKQAEEELKQRMEELERFNHATVGRELRMVELKKEVNELSLRLGRPAPYQVDFNNKGHQTGTPEEDRYEQER